LPLNVLNEKIYLFQWFWFLILLALTICLVVFRLAMVLSPGVRLCCLK
jgi:hypothetical protein